MLLRVLVGVLSEIGVLAGVLPRVLSRGSLCHSVEKNRKKDSSENSESAPGLESREHFAARVCLFCLGLW